MLQGSADLLPVKTFHISRLFCHFASVFGSPSMGVAYIISVLLFISDSILPMLIITLDFFFPLTFGGIWVVSSTYE